MAAAAAAAEVAGWIYAEPSWLAHWRCAPARARKALCRLFIFIFYSSNWRKMMNFSLSLSLVLSPPLYNISYESIWRFFFFRLKPSGQTTSGRHGSSAANAAEDTPFRWDYTLNNATVLADSACGVVDSFVQSLVRSFVCSFWCVALFSILYYKRFRTDVEICI